MSISNNKKQFEVFSQQLRLSFFADYTKRYQEIILNFPETINEPNFSFDGLEKDVRDKTIRYMRAYFDLCSEEFHLNQKLHIDEDVWKIWKSGIEFAFKKKAFQDAWLIIIKDTIYSEEFIAWINAEIKKNKSIVD